MPCTLRLRIEMRRSVLSFGCVALISFCQALSASTIFKLSLDELVDKSTLIVRGRIGGCEGVLRGATVYTECAVSVSETLKGRPGAALTVSIPGGVAGKVRQTVAGAPRLERTQHYVLFIWTSPRGTHQIIGLSQGVFELRDASGGQMAERGPIEEATVVDGSGQEVADRGISIRMADLRARIAGGRR